MQFVAADATKLPRGEYDLITIFNSMHHFNDPVLILRHCREALTAHGTCFIVDLDLSPNPEDNINLTGRVAYAVMTLSCLSDSVREWRRRPRRRVEIRNHSEDYLAG